jgi:endoglucanase
MFFWRMPVFRPICLLFLFSLGLFAPASADEAKPAPAASTAPAPVPPPLFKRPPVPPPPPGAPIRINTVGFRPDSLKRATIAAACDEYRILSVETGAIVFTGKAGLPVETAVTDTGGETVRILDFSALRAPGRYVLDVPAVGRSAPFVIAADVWNEPYRVATRAMYLWRCGVAVDAAWDGKKYHHAPCHLGDGLLDLVGGPAGTRQAGTGGWHDAGDYNKYIVNAGVTVGLMFKAWEQFRDRIAPVGIGNPESGRGLPDLLAELKFEFDWMFTMQMADGRVYQKLSAANFSYWGPPDLDPSPRYFVPWSSTATADFTAMMALGARHFREFDAPYADRCLAAARRSWAFLLANPDQHDADETGVRTGVYAADDRPHRLWAAVELWETTGDAACLQYFEQRVGPFEFSSSGPSWADVRDLAFGAYLLSSRGSERNKIRVWRLAGSLDAVAGRIVENARVNPHGRPFGAAPADFFWGCNGSVAAQTYLLHVADRVRPNPAYRATAEQALAYLFGRNYHGCSYVTGLGAHPPEHTHDRRGEPQLPGYLVGGPWPTAREWYDLQRDPSRNEIAINWNGALIYALAAFVEPPAIPPR